MSDDKSEAPEHAPPPQRLPGVFACHRAIERLTRFRDLIIHRQQWAPYLTLARPLDDLLPNLSPPDVPREVDRAIAHLQPSVARDLWRMDIATEFTFEQGAPYIDDDTRKVRHRDRHVDFIMDFFRLPDDNYGRTFEFVFHALEQGIGAYTERKEVAKREWWNPLRWIAALLRAPVFVLEEAGYLTESNRKAIAFVQVLWSAAIAVILWLLGKKGIEIPGEIVKTLSP